MRFVPACLAFSVVFGVAIATAQVIYNTSSTAGEGYQRGMGAVISAQGERNLSDSQAAINLTEARSNQIDNQLKSVNAYWEKNDIYNQHQHQKFYEIGQDRQRKIARRGPIDLSPEEFDRTTGQITWPGILEQAPFEEYRTRIDELFRKRSYEGALTGDEYVEATAALNGLRAALMSQRDQFPQSILEQTMRFQLKLKRELDDNLG